MPPSSVDDRPDTDAPAERAIRDALAAVAALGEHRLLAETTILLVRARDILADYLDFVVPAPVRPVSENKPEN